MIGRAYDGYLLMSMQQVAAMVSELPSGNSFNMKQISLRPRQSKCTQGFQLVYTDFTNPRTDNQRPSYCLLTGLVTNRKRRLCRGWSIFLIWIFIATVYYCKIVATRQEQGRSEPWLLKKYQAMVSKSTVILIAFLLASYILAGVAISSASAGEVDCKGLIPKIKAGERYAVSIDIQKEAMRVQTASNYCFDPIDDWIKRGLALTSTPPLFSGATEAPAAGYSSPPNSTSADMLSPPPTLSPDGRVLPSLTNAERESAPPSMSFVGGGIRKARKKSSASAASESAASATASNAPPPTSDHISVGKEGTVVSPPGQKETSAGPAGQKEASGGPAGQPKGAKCNRSLGEFWQAGTVDIDGKRNWLLGVYTIDQNDDQITDNMVFKVRTQGRVDRVIRYFPVERGDVAAKNIADLKLDNENLVGSICSGNLVFKGPTAKEMAIAEGKDNPALQCKWKLKNFWQGGAVDIKGTDYWLSGVFSIDLDGDGGVDNIGFKLQTRGKVGNVIRYFPIAAGQLSGQAIPDLALKDDNDVFKMCAGNLTFERPKSLIKIAEMPAVASPGDEKPGKEEKNQEATKKEKPKPSLFSKLKLSHFILIGGILLIGASLYGAYSLNRKDDDEDEEDEDEDEEYDEEDA